MTILNGKKIKKNMKRKVKLTEGDLHRIVKESIKRVLKENDAIEYSPEEICLAWEKLWERINQTNSPDLINTNVYYKYKDNPEGIKNWFDRYSKWHGDIGYWVNQ